MYREYTGHIDGPSRSRGGQTLRLRAGDLEESQISMRGCIREEHTVDLMWAGGRSDQRTRGRSRATRGEARSRQ